jgi:Cytidylyltransferase.
MELNINERFLSQIVNDCLYKNLYNNYKNEDRFLKLLCESGAIEENRTEIDDKAIKDYSLLTLPLLDFVQDNEKELAIIVSTGSFSPMHKGHVDAMNIAKEYVENKLGYQVIQGVMSLSHDNYVAFKNNGIAKSNISIRTDKAYEAIKKKIG